LRNGHVTREDRYEPLWKAYAHELPGRDDPPAALLTATASTPVWGKLADLFNKKLLVQIAIVIFVVGSMLAGLAQNAGELIAARAFQGISHLVGGIAINRFRPALLDLISHL